MDIALLSGTTSGAPYDPLSALEESNSSASVSDQRWDGEQTEMEDCV